MTDRTIETLLSATAAQVRYPETPDLTGRVVARLEQPAGRRSLAPRLSPGLVALGLALIVAAVLAIDGGREAIARFFGVEGSRIEIVATPLPGVIPTPFPPPAGLEVIARPVSVEEGAALAGFEPVAVPGYTLEQAFFARYGRELVLILRYEGFDIWQTRLEHHGSFGKLASPGDEIIEVRVGGHDGVWLSGSPHLVGFILADGTPVQHSYRTVERSTLIWRTEAFFYRIETDLSLPLAIAIAETLP